MIRLLLALFFSPTMVGLATWYGPPTNLEGDIMANGQPLHLAGYTVAVDRSRQDWLGREVLILTECGGLFRATVTDTGMLEAAGRVRKGVGPLDVMRYWSEDMAGVEWVDVSAYGYVVDFPQLFFREVACERGGDGEGQTVRVMVLVLEGEDG